jgi:hypothetical protein
MQGSRGQREQGEGKVEHYLASVGAFLSLGLLIFIRTVLVPYRSAYRYGIQNGEGFPCYLEVFCLQLAFSEGELPSINRLTGVGFLLIGVDKTSRIRKTSRQGGNTEPFLVRLRQFSLAEQPIIPFSKLPCPPHLPIFLVLLNENIKNLPL